MCDNVRRGAVQLAKVPYKYGLLACNVGAKHNHALQMKCVYQNYAQKMPKEEYRTFPK